MAQSPTPVRKRKKRKPGRPRDEIIRYVFEITAWDWGFSFGVNPIKRDIDPYMDFRHLQVQGNLLQPKGVVADKVELSFLPSCDLDEDRRQANKPTAVGSLDLRWKRLTGILSMPLDSLGPVLQMLNASRFRYVSCS